MIKQEFKFGNNNIVIETAETIQDIEKNNLRPGSYSRYFINGKQYSTYNDILNFIIEENKKESNPVLSDIKTLKKLRNQMVENNTKELLKTINDLKEKYKTIGISEEAMKKINDYSLKINTLGIRVKE